jgi:hypothetical protein
VKGEYPTPSKAKSRQRPGEHGPTMNKIRSLFVQGDDMFGATVWIDDDKHRRST